MTRRDKYNSSNSGGGGGGKGKFTGGTRPPESREVMVSKALSFVLRHGADREGIALDAGGWANVADLLLWRRLSNLHVTFPELQTLVATNDKKRFTMIPNPKIPRHPSDLPTDPTDPSHYLIRAAQGHSIKTVANEEILEALDHADPKCPKFVVHGTDESSWKKIQASGGLRPMNRRLIHFARGVPARCKPLTGVDDRPRKEEEGVDGVISGMRLSATVLVWADLRGSLEKGVKWWRSENNVFLTDGVDGLLGLEWIRWVEKRGTDELFWGEKQGVDLNVGGEDKGRDIERGMGGLKVDVRGANEGSDVTEKEKEKETETARTRAQEKEKEKEDEVMVKKGDTVIKDSWDD